MLDVHAPAAADVGKYLRASATYTDGHGTRKYASAVSGLVQPANAAPTFDDGASTTRSAAENTATGANIGAAVAASDGDIRSRVGQPQGHTQPKAPVPAGDQGHSPGEVKQVAVAAGHRRRLHSPRLNAA